MDNELKKSLVDLIDETLFELEELKKSKFSASEVDLSGPGEDGIAGKPANGSIDKKEDKDEDKDEDEEEMTEKADDEEEDEDEEEMEKECAKADDEEKKEDKKEDEGKMEAKMKKSQDEMASLMKSFVDERVAPLEDKLSTIVDLVNKLANQPVAPRGISSRVVPLSKSADDYSEPLSKAQVASKLLDLKKSGTLVDSLDVAKAEMGQDLELITKKYQIS